MGKKDNFFVDTRNLCFLCYRPAKIISAGVSSRSKDNKTFSLRGLSRYTNVDFQKWLKTVVPTPPAEGNSRKYPQVVVTICSRCSAVAEEFTRLFQYMEFTQMKINSCVRGISELMKKAESNSRLVDKFRKKMKTNGKTEADTVEKIRKKMMESCSSSIKKALPRVRLQKPRANPPQTNEKKKTVKVTASSKPAPRSKKPEFSKMKVDSPNDKSKDLTQNENNSTPTLTHEKNERGERFQCLHCENTFNDTGVLRVHIVEYHREQFFAMFKKPDLSDEDFKIAVELLFQDVREITTNYGDQATVSYVCSCCGKPFPTKIDTYVHMVQLHHDVLSSKLQNLQKNTPLIASAKSQLLDPSATTKLTRGPYKTRSIKNPQNVTSPADNHDVTSTDKTKNAVKSAETIIPPPTIKKINTKTARYPPTCECGVQFNKRKAWLLHKRLNCKLKPNKVKNVSKVIQHPVLKRAKNTVGFPRTCDCGVRLSLKSSWLNHHKNHCKLKFGAAAVKADKKITKSQKNKPRLGAPAAIIKADSADSKSQRSKPRFGEPAAITRDNSSDSKSQRSKTRFGAPAAIIKVDSADSKSQMSKPRFGAPAAITRENSSDSKPQMSKPTPGAPATKTISSNLRSQRNKNKARLGAPAPIAKTDPSDSKSQRNKNKPRLGAPAPITKTDSSDSKSQRNKNKPRLGAPAPITKTDSSDSKSQRSKPRPGAPATKTISSNLKSQRNKSKPRLGAPASIIMANSSDSKSQRSKPRLGAPANKKDSKVSKSQRSKLLFEAAANKSIRTALGKNKGTVTVTVQAKKGESKQPKNAVNRVCKCGSDFNSYHSWYRHQRYSCILKSDTMDVEAMDSLNADVEIEEVPIDISPSGELCLPQMPCSVDDSCPTIVSVSSCGGVIKGLHKVANFQSSYSKEKEETPKILELSSYSGLFSPYLPIAIPAEEIDTSLEKVLQDYKKFPGNISGCPFCGRGFTFITELQNHIVEAHFDEVLYKLRKLIIPNSRANGSYYTCVVDVDPNVVKEENEMEADGNTNDIVGSEQSNDFHSYMEHEEDDVGKIILKNEGILPYCDEDDEGTTDMVNVDCTDSMNDNDNQHELLILP